MDFSNFHLNGVRLFEENGEVWGELADRGMKSRYLVRDADFKPRAKAILMDLDGTTLDSEPFWVYIIAETMRRFMEKPGFEPEDADLPFISGYTTVEHLRYCIDKYCPGRDIREANRLYHVTANEELAKIMRGEGNQAAFCPKPDLKDFLLAVKGAGIRIGLATSGLRYKAIPEITSVFRQIGLGNPLEFYDSVITGGDRKNTREWGTLGEIVCKPYPFIYSELAYMGLGVKEEDAVIGIEDSTAGVLSLRFAGFPVIGLNSGTIRKSGTDTLCHAMVDNLADILKVIL